MKHTLLDNDLHYDHIKIFCDNSSTIHMTNSANNIIKSVGPGAFHLSFDDD